MEDIIEEKRKALTARTPVTLERLIEWLEKKKAAAAAAENADLEEKRAAYAKTGKAAGVVVLPFIDSWTRLTQPPTDSWPWWLLLAAFLARTV